MGNLKNAATYRSYLTTIKNGFNETFWDSKKGRYISTIDINSTKYDYGFTYLNMMAVEYGLADLDKANLIYSWLDGRRIISGDTSTGSDIYNEWKWAARSNAVAIESKKPYWWHDYDGAISVAGNSSYGTHLENGGAIFYTSYDDIMGRLISMGADNAYLRLSTIIEEFSCDELRRRPLNSFGLNWIIGIIGEYPESGIVPLVVNYGFLGMSAKADGLHIAPKLPSSLTFIGMKDICYKGVHYKITASKSVTTATITDMGSYYDVQVPNAQEIVVLKEKIILNS